MKAKRWVSVVALVVVLAVILGGTAGCGSKTKEQQLIDSVVVTYDVLQGKVELKYTIDKGLLDAGCLKAYVSLVNKSQSTIKQTEAIMRVFDAAGKVLWYNYALFVDIKPGETEQSAFDLINFLWFAPAEAKKITITLWKVWT